MVVGEDDDGDEEEDGDADVDEAADAGLAFRVGGDLVEMDEVVAHGGGEGGEGAVGAGVAG